MGVMLSCGGALRWARDVLFPGLSYDEIAALAQTAPAGADGLTFVPYLTGERSPHNDPTARAAFAGLTLAHGRGHLARAVFEGVTFGLLDSLDVLRRLGAAAGEVRITSGGARSEFWGQMIADVYGVPVIRLANDEGPAFGAAILAGVGTGVWPDVSAACRATVHLAGKVLPSGASYSEAVTRYRSLYSATREWNHEIAS